MEDLVDWTIMAAGLRLPVAMFTLQPAMNQWNKSKKKKKSFCEWLRNVANLQRCVNPIKIQFDEWIHNDNSAVYLLSRACAEPKKRTHWISGVGCTSLLSSCFCFKRTASHGVLPIEQTMELNINYICVIFTFTTSPQSWPTALSKRLSRRRPLGESRTTDARRDHERKRW